MAKVDATLPELGDSEKTREPSISSFDLNDKDEALRLVGLERAETFTQEEYLRVRRKLVSLRRSPPLRFAIPSATFCVRIGLFLRFVKQCIARSICMSLDLIILACVDCVVAIRTCSTTQGLLSTSSVFE